MDLFKDWIIANFGVSALVLIGLIIIAIYIGGWIMKFKKELQTKPCEAHKNAIDEQSKKLDVESALLHEIKGELKSFARLESEVLKMSNTLQLLATGIISPTPLTQSHSPISLTPKGEEIAKALNIESIIDLNWHRIERAICGETNPYDIQMKFISEFISRSDKYIDVESLDNIKTNAFANGIPLIDYMRMIGVMSRDRYFKEHGIDVKDVDKSNPILSE